MNKDGGTEPPRSSATQQGPFKTTMRVSQADCSVSFSFVIIWNFSMLNLPNVISQKQTVLSIRFPININDILLSLWRFRQFVMLSRFQETETSYYFAFLYASGPSSAADLWLWEGPHWGSNDWIRPSSWGLRRNNSSMGHRRGPPWRQGEDPVCPTFISITSSEVLFTFRQQRGFWGIKVSGSMALKDPSVSAEMNGAF